MYPFIMAEAKNFRLFYCYIENYTYICIDLHLKQATDVRQPLPDWPFLWPIGT